MLHEPDVALTDWILAIECAIFCWLLLRQPKSNLRTVSIAVFAAAAASSLLGGMYHGLFPLGTATSLGQWMWYATMLSIGATSAAVLTLSAIMIRSKQVKTVAQIAVAGFIGYAYYVVAVSDAFITAIQFYLPSLLLFFGVTVIRFSRDREKSLLPALASVPLMLIAAGLQQLHIGLHPAYFNHNALYHLIQGIALWLLFLSLQKTR